MPTFIDICCGAGGFSIGMVDAGCELLAGVDIDALAVRAFNMNHPGKAIRADLHDFSLPEGCVDVLVAGLPCQGFSTLGRRDPTDQRNLLWEPFLRLVKAAKPAAGAVENVKPFLKSTEFARLREELQNAGYNVVSGTVVATHFGVPQKRERALVLFGQGVEPEIPQGGSATPTVAEALAGLPIQPDGCNDHNPRHHGSLSRRRFPHVPPGGTRHDLPDELLSPCWRKTKNGASNSFGRLRWDGPADTLRTVFLKPETGRFIHPEAHRGLTVREGARLQGFRDEHQFSGNQDERAKLIGNAVPPPIGAAVGKELIRIVEAIRGRRKRVAAGPVPAQ